MNRILITLMILFLLMLFITRIDFSDPADHLMPESMMALGFTLIAAFLLAKIIEQFGLPRITSYLLTGVLIGPFFIDLLTEPVVKNLHLIDHFALGLIALTAGGEFKLKVLRNQLRVGLYIFLFQLLFSLILIISLFFVIYPQVSFLIHHALPQILGVSLIFGIISVSMSPATTIAIITETRAKGPFTDFILAMTVFLDIVVILLFAIILSVAKPLIQGGSQIELTYLATVVMHLILSAGIGMGMGFVIIFYLKYINEGMVIFLVGFLLFGVELSRTLHLEMIILFVVSGVVVENFSKLGHNLIGALERTSLPIFIIFFALTGASLDFNILLDNWLLAALLVGTRLVALQQASYWGGRVSSATRSIKKTSWMGFSGQAGISLGLGIMAAETISGEIGEGIRSLVFAAVAINQLIGPILFKNALKRAGEIPEDIMKSDAPTGSVA